MKHNEMMCPVLIVDDDNDLCRILEVNLRRICPVHVEHTLENAGLYLAGIDGGMSLPQVVLLDNSLPDGKGVTYISHMQALYPGVKVVLMTADTTEGLEERAMKEGACFFIAKPFRVSTINEVIASICPELRAA